MRAADGNHARDVLSEAMASHAHFLDLRGELAQLEAAAGAAVAQAAANLTAARIANAEVRRRWWGGGGAVLVRVEGGNERPDLAGWGGRAGAQAPCGLAVWGLRAR